MWGSLPDVKFAGMVFTMPDVAVGAAVIQEWAKEVYGARLMIMVVCHTFDGHLNFNPHLHILASAGGLRISMTSGSQNGGSTKGL
jgi:Putative transposase